MQFPERPTCHNSDYQAGRFTGMPRHESWPAEMPDHSDANGHLFAQAGVRQGENGSEWITYPWRACGYCGSIHPEDLLAFLDAGKAKLCGADWKYGWPHKFYVEIVNPEPDRLFEVGSKGWSEGFCEQCNGVVTLYSAVPECDGQHDAPRCGSNCRSVSLVDRPTDPIHSHEPAALRAGTIVRRDERYTGKRETLHAKFYNVHLQDDGFDDEAFQRMTTALQTHAGILFELREGKLHYSAPHHDYQR